MAGTFKLAIKYICLTYVATGLAYSVSGYIYRAVIGKQEVFSPLIGIPMDVLFWPWAVYADLKHIGVMPQDVLVVLSIAICIVILTRRQILLKKCTA